MAVVDVAGVVKSYGGHRVVDDVTFSVEEGEIFGVVGPNGAGKTTLVESIEGLRTPDSGSVSVMGLDPIRDRSRVTEVLGAQLQESRLQDRARVGELLDTYASFYRDPVDWTDLVTLVGLDDKVDARYSELSGGMKQKLSAALALVGSPRVVVLDELTTGLDPRARRSTWDMIEMVRDSGVTVLLVTHFMDEADRLCDRIMVLKEGRPVAIDSPEGLVRLAGTEQRMRFRTSAALPVTEIQSLGGVAEAREEDGRVHVSGGPETAQVVLTFLSSRGVVANELRVDHTSLEDAYLSLTGERSGSAESAPGTGHDA